ncbi:MAG: hypothetical protein Fur009_6170 [Candidatus Microgenomates bacterium]
MKKIKKYLKPRIKINKIKINFFSKKNYNLEEFYLAGYTCNETRIGYCAI